MNETDNKTTELNTDELNSETNQDASQESQDASETVQQEDSGEIFYPVVDDDDSNMYSFPSIAKRISTNTGLFSAFLVLIPLLIASTLAFLNQGASPKTQEAVASSLSQNATRVADSLQWQLAAQLDTPLNTSARSVSSGTSGPLLPKLERELDYQFFDVLYDIASPLPESITTSNSPKLQDILSDVAAPIEAEGGLLYVYDSSLRPIYASNSENSDAKLVANATLKNFSGEGFTEAMGETGFVARRDLGAAQWQMVLYQPAPSASASNIALMRPLAWLTLLGPLLALLLGNLWGFFRLQRPLNELREGVNRLLNGKQTASLPRNRADELGLLTQEVSLLSQKFSAVVVEEAEPKERLFEAQERIRQQYLRETYPEQYKDEEETSSDNANKENVVKVESSNKNKNDVQKDAVSKAELDKAVKKASEEAAKVSAKVSEVDKKAIADLEKALEEARASQTSLTESNLQLESQLKEIKDSNQQLVPKDKIETELMQLQQQLGDSRKALKGHIRAAKASAVGFNVSDSEANMNAAESELEGLDNLITTFGVNSLGLKPLPVEEKVEASTKQDKSSRKNKQQDNSSFDLNPKKTINSKTSSSKTSSSKTSSAKSSTAMMSNSGKDIADASTPLVDNISKSKSANKPAKTGPVKTESDKTKSTKTSSLKPEKTAVKSDSKQQSNTETVDVSKQDMLTPLPNLGIAVNAPTTQSAIAAKDIDANVLEPVKPAPVPANPNITSDNTEANKAVSPKVDDDAKSVNIAAINYDAALALEIEKDLDLKSSLENYLQGFKLHTQIQVEHYIAELNVSDQQKVLLRDFSKATFDNIAKHSDASSVLLELNPSKDETNIELVIVDNGKGFDPETLSERSKIAQFKKAFSILNGELTLLSGPNQGTMINARLPL